MQEGPRPDLAELPQASEPSPSPPLAWTRLDLALLAGVTIFGALLRFIRLGYPNAYVFDEVYYAKDACLYLAKPQAFCNVNQSTEQSFVHPPLGKWIIATGIKVFGYNTFGWRIMAAVFGTALIVVTFMLGRKLLGRWAGAAAGLLVATDFLLIVQSRVAMLDIFLTFFVALGFHFVVLEWDRVRRMEALGTGKLVLRWRIAAGLAFGAASSVKWSGAYALAGAGLILIFVTVHGVLQLQRPRLPGERPPAPGPLTELNFTLAGVGLPAVAVYLVSYGVWFWDHHFSLSEFRALQSSMLQYHLHLTQKHVYASPAYKWPTLWRPVAYYFQGGNTATHILAFGNPAVWWPCLAVAVWLAYKAIVRRDAPSAIILTAWVSQFVPWLPFSRPQFFFYMAPIVPFMMLGLAATLKDIVHGYQRDTALAIAGAVTILAGATALVLVWHALNLGPNLDAQRRIVLVAGVPILLLALAVCMGSSEAARPYRVVLVVAYLAFACGLDLWYFYPVVAAITIPFQWWQQRMLLPSWI